MSHSALSSEANTIVALTHSKAMPLSSAYFMIHS
jgi:purine nucleoside permease